ncbi:hypothetical protein ACU5AX_19155 [Sphingomonas sp. XXL09]|uniref:hypothetical protein n=1 Tax=Sphingomonas sp. XXL09 TaxID=3457787 RepID=UPI00406BB488
MMRDKGFGRGLAIAPLLLLVAMAAEPLPAGVPDTRLALLDLSQPFAARSGWRFVATQGPQVADPLGEADDRAPGVVRLCISRDGGRTCAPRLGTLLALPGKPDLFDQPHFLEDARIVRPRPDRPLLLIRAASLHSGDGDQRVATIALGYDRTRDAFVPVYEKRTGRNNNQEVRYIATGPLRGAIVAAEPTSDAPFAYWITVDRLGPDGRYHQALRYRSRTRYGDGNPKAVIDSDMAETLRRLPK